MSFQKRVCDQPGCKEFFENSGRGVTNAHQSGWHQYPDGTVYCPSHKGGVKPQHEFDFFNGASGRACTVMVEVNGYGEDCGLPPDHPIHYMPGHKATQCRPEGCGGIDYDPCEWAIINERRARNAHD